MKKAFFYLTLHFLAISLSAQLQDDFSAPSLDPQWQGNTANFTINSGELQSNDNITNVSTLYAFAPTSLAAVTTWDIYARCEFSPSSSNFTKIYLAASQPPVDGAAFDGYFLKIGGISGADDALELYRQDGASSTLLLSGTTGAAGTDPVDVRISVSRTTAGLWTVEADYTGGEDFDSEGTVTDNTYPSSLYFGFSCTYTSTRGMSFFFDDITVEPLVMDTEGAQLLSVVPTSSNTIQLGFNEPLEAISASDINNYNLNAGFGMPTTATPEIGDATKVNLTFSQPLQNLTDYIISIDNLIDLSGNNSGMQTLSFSFLIPETATLGDLIITEIMADPSPPVGLPNTEYVELYNASNKVLQVGGLGLATSSSPKIINDAVLLPGEYIVIVDDEDLATFETYGKVATINSFPALTNAGSALSLVDEGGNTLAFVQYTDDWYRDLAKKEGGFSLELIDLGLSQECPGNWRASNANFGGTPAAENSLNGTPVDAIPPVLTGGYAETATEVVLTFDDALEMSAEDASLYSLSPNITIGDALIENGGFSIRLFLSAALTSEVIYSVTVHDGIADCLGNSSTNNQRIDIGLSVIPSAGDLIINEILFNPYTGGVDFVELYNPSSKILNLAGLRLRNEAITSGTMSTTVNQQYTLFPGNYVVFTPDPDIILSQYFVLNENALIENDLPSLGDKGGNLSVYNTAFEILDSLTYSEDWHSALLSDRNGVSLERLRTDSPTSLQANWHSAASVVGYATPTARNSQFRDAEVEPEAEMIFTLPENTFSPDGDGYQDALEIFYDTDQVGYAAKITIFDGQGRHIINTITAPLLAGQGSFLWDGVNANGERSRIGIYVLFIELFTPNGDTRQEKLVCVLAGKL